jgi:hypothetical protein
MLENKFAEEVVKTFINEASPNTTECALEYQATTVSSLIPRYYLRGVLPQVERLDWQPVKHILSLKLVLVRRSITQLKEEMMTRYADDGYYFLEAYIDGMVECGIRRMIDG